MKTFPILYKKTSTGAIQFWEIVAGADPRLAQTIQGYIRTTYGRLGTDSPQVTEDVIKKGKNIGKKNETNCVEQAVDEAQSKHDKQKKKGYVESIGAAQAEQLDELIEGGIVPMLAHKFSEQGHKIKYPAYAQPKLDGIRCIAMVKDGKVSLWSRTRKRITSMPHIEKEIDKIGFVKDMILDGELYNHDFKKDFEKIVSAVRKENPEEGYINVQYHIYDIADDSTFGSRQMTLRSLFGIHQKVNGDFKYLKRVTTMEISNEEELMEAYLEFKAQGYEGAMVRNDQSLYVNKRSYDLLKIKEMEDGEFPITDVEEGRGKLQGHVGSFVCKLPSGETFLAKMAGETSKLKEYFENPSLWQGKRLTVQFQGLTTYGMPRFPVGKAIRDYE